MTLPEETTEAAPPPEAPKPTSPFPPGTPLGAPLGTAAPKPRTQRREPLHFVVVVLLIADIIFGLGLAVFAEKVLMFRPMAIMGCGLSALGLGVLAYFVLFGGGKGNRW
jgi:hypothetical protein